jgi:hypothetical protein
MKPYELKNRDKGEKEVGKQRAIKNQTKKEREKAIKH